MLKLSANEFDAAYKIMEESFPKSELRPYDKMKDLFMNEELILYGLHREGKICAAIIAWEFEEFIFLENFAVDGKIRGRGIGSKFLKDIKKEFSKDIILEVEDPFDEMSKKRIQFYKRNGFILTEFGYMQPPLNDEVNDIPLRLMCYPNAIDEKTFSNLKTMIFETVFKC